MSNDRKTAAEKVAATKLLSLVVQESEKRIQAQVQVMIAVDSRSNSLLSVSAALTAAASGIAAAQFSDQGLSPFVAGAGFAALCSGLAAAMAIKALWPRDVDVSGWSPSLLLPDLEKGKPEDQILKEMALQNQRKIAANEKCGGEIGTWVKGAMIALASSPLIGGLAAFIVAFWPSCG